MMPDKDTTPSELLKALRERGGVIRREGDQLVVRAPSEGLPAELISLLREHRLELLAFLRSAESLPPMTRIEGEEGPLSYAQHRMWFLNQIDGDVGVFNMPMAWKFDGRVDVQALEQAIQLLGERHESLRTRFVERNDELRQVIGSKTPPLERRSVDSLEHCRVLLSELGRQPLDTEAAPPWQAILLTTAAGEHVLYLNFHHVLIDGQSITLIMEELSLCYRIALGLDSAPPTQNDFRYLDYAAWLRKVVELPGPPPVSTNGSE